MNVRIYLTFHWSPNIFVDNYSNIQMYSNIHYALELIANFCVIILFCIYLCPSDIDSSLGKKFDKWMAGLQCHFLSCSSQLKSTLHTAPNNKQILKFWPKKKYCIWNQHFIELYLSWVTDTEFLLLLPRAKISKIFAISPLLIMVFYGILCYKSISLWWNAKGGLNHYFFAETILDIGFHTLS
jgi:hypothetical protein